MMTSLLGLVESLEIGLTDPKTVSQKDSINALLDGLKGLDVNTVDTKEVTHLVEFLVSRLVIGDPEITNNLLASFLWLARSLQKDGEPLLTPTQAAYICQKGLFGHLNVQSLTKSNRIHAFQLLHLLLHGPQLTGLKALGHDFVFSYVQAIDGEKDPENLVLIFEMNLIVMETFPMDRIAEDFFESMAVYFPVDFSPPPGSQVNGITRSRLADLLHRCLFTSRSFAGSFLLPLLCEKADSEWPQAQSDSFALLSDCLHGRLHSTTSDASGTYGLSIPLHHLSCFLVLIVPILAKMSTRSLSKELNSSVLACFSGLVHCYSSQNATLNQLQDFVSILLKSFGIPVVRESTELTDPPVLPTNQAITYLSETLRACETNGTLAELLTDKMVPYFCDPIKCYAQETVEHIPVELSKLMPWKPSFTIACRLLDAVPSTLSDSDLTSRPSHESDLELLHSRLSHLLSNVYRWLRIDNATFSASDHSLELHHLSDLILTLVALSVRLHASALRSAIPIQSAELMQLSELLCYLIHHYRIIFPDLPTNRQQLTRDELCTIVSCMYSVPCPPAVDKLNGLLFGQLHVIDGSVGQTDLVLDILQHASLLHPTILERLLTFLLNTAIKKSSIQPAIGFVGTLHFLSRAFLDLSAAKSSQLVGYVQHFVTSQAGTIRTALRLQTCTMYPVSLVDQANSAFRILTALSETDNQCALLHSWQVEPSTPSAYDEPLLLAAWCGILSGAHPQVVSLQNPVNLLTDLLKCVDKLESITDSLRLSLSALIAQAYGSVLNKCGEALSQDIRITVLDAANQLWSQCTTAKSNREFFADWLISCLHGTLSHPDQGRLSLVDQLLNFLLHPYEISLQTTHSGHSSCLPEADMISVLNCTLSRLPKLGHSASNGDAASTVCHWQTTPLYSQKLYHLIALPLASKVDSLIPSPSPDVPQLGEVDLTEAYLSSLLHLWSFMPDKLLTSELKKLLHYCLLAVSRFTHYTTQLQGIRLLYNLIKGVASQPDQLSTCDMDDLFTVLPRVASNAAPLDSAVATDTEATAIKSSALIRLSIARCLSCLVHLPSSVTSRYRDTEVLPLLSRLLDDPNRSVRMEAARAQNTWFLLT